MKKITLILSCTLLILTGCDTEKRRNIIVPIDNSTSVPSAVMQRYINMIQEALVPNLGARDRLTVVFVDGCSQSRAERVYSVDLAERSFENAKDGINHAEDSMQVRLNRYLLQIKEDVATAILSKRRGRSDCGDFTDIVNGLNESQSLIERSNNYKSNTDKILNSIAEEENYEYDNIVLLCSDMINENSTRTYDFTSFGKISEDVVNDKVAALKRENKIPDLSGAKIIVYGATNSKYAGTFAEQQIINIRLFWESFFHTAGAQVVAYGYDTEIELKKYLKSKE